MLALASCRYWWFVVPSTSLELNKATTRRSQSAERLAGGQLIQRQMPRAEHCQPFILGAADVKEKSGKFKE